MKSSGRVTWAGIEFQPDLTKPRKPVRLGVLLTSPNGSVLLGRQPLRESLPPEFQGLGPMTLDLAANWIDSMWKDLLEADKENPLARLNERWRWNLYLVQPHRVHESKDLLALGKTLYGQFVKEPFSLNTPHREARRPHSTRRRSHGAGAIGSPPAWLVSENTKRTSARVLGACA